MRTTDLPTPDVSNSDVSTPARTRIGRHRRSRARLLVAAALAVASTAVALVPAPAARADEAPKAAAAAAANPVVASGSAAAPADAAKAIQGSWRVVKRVKNGEATSDEEVRRTPVVLTFAGTAVTEAKGGQASDEGAFALDAAASPPRITMTGKTGGHAGQAFAGIYELAGDTLKIAYGVGEDAAKAAPKDFAGGPGAGLLVLQREPADAKADAAAKDEGVVELYNGKDLTGWGYKPGESFDGAADAPDQRYSAKPGVIVVNPVVGKKNAALWTAKSFPGDFELRLEFRASVNADSGLFVRKPQLQVRDYLVAGPYKQLKKYKPQDWNEIVVVVKGNVAHCTCNGEVLEAALKVPETGPIGLESDRGTLEYRNLRLRPLK